MNGKRSIKKSERNFPVKKSLRLVKAKTAQTDEKEGRREDTRVPLREALH